MEAARPEKKRRGPRRCPSSSVSEIDTFGWEVGRAGASTATVTAAIEMNVGYGEHTTHYSTVVMAEESLALEDFRAALLAAKVSEKP